MSRRTAGSHDLSLPTHRHWIRRTARQCAHDYDKLRPASRHQFGFGRGCLTTKTQYWLYRSLLVSTRFNWAAVFQPRKHLHLTQPLDLVHIASIGPRSFNRGNIFILLSPSISSILLQLGRGLSTAETYVCAVVGTKIITLQLGRGCSTAETALRRKVIEEASVLQLGRGLSTAETVHLQGR